MLLNKEEEIATLKLKNETLAQENYKKETYFKQQKRNSKDFEDEVYEREQCIEMKINKQKEYLNASNKLNEELKSSLKESLLQVEDLRSKLLVLESVNIDMLSTIKTLTTDNDAYALEVVELKNKLYILSNKSQTNIEQTENELKKHNEKTKNRNVKHKNKQNGEEINKIKQLNTTTNKDGKDVIDLTGGGGIKETVKKEEKCQNIKKQIINLMRPKGQRSRK
ncbi:unnamed protein product [Psylliodes chrysocephalus]|uniref:Uncharacterized protein n=1 Tax=Psylliodes chrysocephalus TaxID=3402493 RepID=A0A9P0G711_9CUCU|nr:unnamed protein product [Psylliodes chrysocephala]